MKLYNGTKAEKIIFVCFGLLVIGLGVIIYLVRAEDSKFVKEGIRVEGTVTGLYMSGTTKRRNYTMSVSMFTQGEKNKEVHTDTTGKSAGDKVLDKIFDDIKSNTRAIGNYQSVTISISSDAYYKYQNGDHVTVVYLKENPKKVKLLSDLE